MNILPKTSVQWGAECGGAAYIAVSNFNDCAIAYPMCRQELGHFVGSTAYNYCEKNDEKLNSDRNATRDTKEYTTEFQKEK